MLVSAETLVTHSKVGLIWFQQTSCECDTALPPMLQPAPDRPDLPHQEPNNSEASHV